MKMRFMTLAAAIVAVGIMASCSSDSKKANQRKVLKN